MWLFVCFGGEFFVIVFCFCKVDGRLLSCKEIDRLNGDEFFCKFLKFRNDFCLISMEGVVFGRFIVKGLFIFLIGIGFESICI